MHLTPKTLLPALAAALLAWVPSADPIGRPAAEPGDSSASAFSTKEAAAAIDRLVLRDLTEAGLKPNSRADDATFARRAYQTVVGRIPTGGEISRFVKDRARDKRALLIDQLLDSPAHNSRMFNWWADLLRAKTRLNRRISGEPYMHWIKESVAANKPYDKMVFEMLTAEGAAHEPGKGATGYYLRDRGMPEDNMGNTVRVFLGTRLECAQCHNHPFDKWTQKQFFEMAAFTGGMQFVDGSRARSSETRRLRAVINEMKSTHGDQVARRLQRTVIQPLLQGIKGNGTGVARLPKEYQYDDAKPRQIMTAKTIFGESPKVDAKAVEPRQSRRQPRGRRRGRQRESFPQVDSRRQYAGWLTADENPRFRKVIANRMWKLVMGQGLIEPVDDIKEDTKASNPELMAHLEKVMSDVDYDLRRFLRVLLNTSTFQRTAATTEPEAGEAFHFTGPVMRRMTAEQIWDSMLTLVTDEVDGTLGAPDERAKAVYDRFADIENMTEGELREMLDEAALRYTNPAKFRANQRKERQERQEKQMAKVRPLQRALRNAQRRRDAAAVERIKGELRKLGLNPDRRRRPGGRRGGGRLSLRRASELPAPTPPGHFLREFGQSDRESIEGGHQDPTVPQVLNLMNGFVEDRVLAPSSAVMSDVNAARGVRGKVEAAYMTVLNRKPSQSEINLWRDDLTRDVARGSRDLVWTLVNTHEFLFVK